jgi:hypothetical protein
MPTLGEACLRHAASSLLRPSSKQTAGYAYAINSALFCWLQVSSSYPHQERRAI